MGPYRSAGRSPDTYEIDICTQCGSAFFDGGELLKSLRDNLPPNTSVEEPVKGPDQQRSDEPARLNCLRCASPMEVLRGSAAPWLIYDRCPRCRACWIGGKHLRQLEDPMVVVLALASGEFR